MKSLFCLLFLALSWGVHAEEEHAQMSQGIYSYYAPLMQRLISDINGDIKKIVPDNPWLAGYSDKSCSAYEIYFISKQQIYGDEPQAPEHLRIYCILLDKPRSGKIMNALENDESCIFPDLGFKLGAEIVIQGEARKPLFEILRSLILKRCAELHDARRKLDAIKSRSDSLRRIILPPKDTPKSDVEAIYGEGKAYGRVLRGAPPPGTVGYSYILLPPDDKTQDFRALLNVIYKDGKVFRSSINHYCVVKGSSLRGYSPRLDVEAGEVLADLTEINDKFSGRLKNASWNVK